MVNGAQLIQILCNNIYIWNIWQVELIETIILGWQSLCILQ